VSVVNGHPSVLPVVVVRLLDAELYSVSSSTRDDIIVPTLSQPEESESDAAAVTTNSGLLHSCTDSLSLKDILSLLDADGHHQSGCAY